LADAWATGTAERQALVAAAQQQREQRRAAAWAHATEAAAGPLPQAAAAAASSAQAAWACSDERSARLGAAFKRAGLGGGSGFGDGLSNSHSRSGGSGVAAATADEAAQVWVRARAAWVKQHPRDYAAAQARAPQQLAEGWAALHGGDAARAAAAAVDLLDSEASSAPPPELPLFLKNKSFKDISEAAVHSSVTQCTRYKQFSHFMLFAPAK
jgi:hypothetical protein